MTWYPGFEKALMNPVQQGKSPQDKMKEDVAFQMLLNSIEQMGSQQPEMAPPRPALNDTELGIASLGTAFLPDQNERFQQVTQGRLGVKDRAWQQQNANVQARNEANQKKATLKVKTAETAYDRTLDQSKDNEEMRYKWAENQRKAQTAMRRDKLMRDLQDEKNKGNYTFIIEQAFKDGTIDLPTRWELLNKMSPSKVNDINSKIRARDVSTDLALRTMDAKVVEANNKALKVGAEVDLTKAKTKVQQIMAQILPDQEARKWSELAALKAYHDALIKLGYDKIDMAELNRAAADAEAADKLFVTQEVTAQAEILGLEDKLKNEDLDDDEKAEINNKLIIAKARLKGFQEARAVLKSGPATPDQERMAQGVMNNIIPEKPEPIYDPATKQWFLPDDGKDLFKGDISAKPNVPDKIKRTRPGYFSGAISGASSGRSGGKKPVKKVKKK